MKKLILFLSIFLLSNLLRAQAGDCPPEFLCVGGTFTAQAGTIDELNNTNNGCLNSNEATSSYWFRICVAVSGTVAFTINPNGINNDNDYDFAVWNGSTCMPTTNPIRCSYAAIWGSSDNTGLANTIPIPGDNSEGVFGDGWVNSINAPAGNCYILNINNYGNGSNTFNLTFTGTATLVCSPLPVELVDLYGEADGKRNIIYWSTASEINNDYFTVLRSDDAINWQDVQEIDGAGNSNNMIQYQCYDNKLNKGITYYKLEQTDYDGTTKIYGPIAITNDTESRVIVRIFDIHGRDLGKILPDENGIFFIQYEDGSVDKVGQIGH